MDEVCFEILGEKDRKMKDDHLSKETNTYLGNRAKLRRSLAQQTIV